MLNLDEFDDRTLEGVARLSAHNSDFKAFVDYLKRQDLKVLHETRSSIEDTAVRLCQGGGKVLEQLLDRIREAPNVVDHKKLPKKEGVY